MNHLSDEIIRLQELHASGVLTDDEFARAKAAVIAQGDDASDSLSQIRFESELARVDREWELERETYMVTGKYGARHVPSEGGGLVAIFLGGGFMLFWTVTAYSAGAPAILPLFGIVGLIALVCMGVAGMDKAGQYREAEIRYQNRRAELIARKPQPPL